jgi:hypothetical protein
MNPFSDRTPARSFVIPSITSLTGGLCGSAAGRASPAWLLLLELTGV